METELKKRFDTVKMMRDIRDKISEETQGMNLAQLKKYISENKKIRKTKSVKGKKLDRKK